MSHAVTRDRCRGPGRTTGLSPKGCPMVSSQICPTPDPESACLCRDLTRNSAFHSRKSTNPLRSRSLVMQRRGWGQYRSGQGRSRGRRHYTVRLRGKVRSASAVACVSTCSCWGSSLSLGRPGCVSGRQTGWQTHSLAQPSLLQTLSKNPYILS